MKPKTNEELAKKAAQGILFIEIVTKGELFSKRKSYTSARSTIAKHAREVYLSSNKPKHCGICCYNRHIEIAHIKGVASFPDHAFIGEINDITNLMALCPTHHWEFDNDLLDLEHLDHDPQSH